ncbi:MAG TPA: hypothetical protein VFU10_05750 [Gaiellaceae bacterium]|nr:hypothetical protein [Gaiellaceae bacterium]
MNPEPDPRPPPLDYCFALWNGPDNRGRRAAIQAAGYRRAFVERYQLGTVGPRGCAFFFTGRVFNAVLLDSGGVEWTEEAPRKRGPIRVPGWENAEVTADGGLAPRVPGDPGG